MFVPDIQKTYVERDPKNNHYWYPPGATISLYMNLTKAPFNDVAFRRALLTAFNRQEIADKAQLGYVKPASQTGTQDARPGGVASRGHREQGRPAVRRRQGRPGADRRRLQQGQRRQAARQGRQADRVQVRGAR